MRDEADAKGLRFDLDLVWKIALAIIAIMMGWNAISNKTDANNAAVIAKIDGIQAQITSDAKLRDQRDDTYTADQRQLKANVELLKIDVGDLKLAMAKAGLYKGGS